MTIAKELRSRTVLVKTLANSSPNVHEIVRNKLRCAQKQKAKEGIEHTMEKFDTDEVTKDLKIKAPTKLLKVKYGSIELKPGNVLTPTQVKDKPVVEWDAEPGAFYTLVMNDPDAPSRADPQMREILHWCVINIPGSNLQGGEEISGYVGSGPPEGSGLHRYVFLLYKQNGKQEFSLSRDVYASREGRYKHSVAAFAREQGLGDPVAGNYYQAEYDDYVPILKAQMMKAK